MKAQAVNKWVIQNHKVNALKKLGKIDLLNNGGIYAIVNKINGHCYIGQTACFSQRKNGHLGALKRNKHGNPYLQNAYNKYGGHNFEFCVVETIIKLEMLSEREQYWIEKVKPDYNIVKNVFEWGYYKANANEMPDGYFRDGRETFIRPTWHKWVYGGSRNPND